MKIFGISKMRFYNPKSGYQRYGKATFGMRKYSYKYVGFGHWVFPSFYFTHLVHQRFQVNFYL